MAAAEHTPTQTQPDDDDESQSSYVLQDPLEIERVLRALVDARAMISAVLAPEGLVCPTVLLAVRDDGSLLLDGSQRDALNRRIEAATHLACDTRLDSVQIRFRLQAPVRVVHEGYTAFVTPPPESLLRLQRRELYRMRIPPGAPVTLHVGTPDAPPDAGIAGLRVLDISGGGIAVSLPSETEAGFTPRNLLEACLLRLPDGDPIPVRLEVAHVFCRHAGNLLRWHAGCRFVGLPQAAQRRVLQYIFQVERQRNARQRRAV
ncbi:flagellar brake protein [Luteimonas sp. XNQY3]|nr:flagellar brake protein [Luteimonas sp. XNQY3]MCD9008244.1 flagellar brake protein [Luteimonas sp. XNQY3]